MSSKESIYPLFSSSKGNSYFFGTPECGLLVDCGKSYTQIKKALAARKIPFSAVGGILITHTHTDHTAGLRVTYDRERLTVYGQRETIRRLPPTVLKTVCVGRGLFEIENAGGITAEAIPTSHDCVGSCGYKLTFPTGKTAAIVTDLGKTDKDVEEAVAGVYTVVLESNYDPDMLRDCPYDYSTKARIASNRGHLSNEASAHFAAKIIKNGTKQLVLAHLSENSNTPETAQNTCLTILEKEYGLMRGRDFLLSVLDPVCSEESFVL
ncbi:MAG: MBL fold metallo-hydrolase [Ruminococcus sp.]|jgi:phosphoribosyl 1,2-cyclic phosphodiesterase|nr:MBL fold metallo-hydrolase [Ruminococcus sp.]